MPNRYFDDVLHLMQKITPTPNQIPKYFNAMKKKFKELVLDYKSIYCCSNRCKIYYKDDAHLLSYKFCESGRFQERNERHKGSSTSKMNIVAFIPILQ